MLWGRWPQVGGSIEAKPSGGLWELARRTKWEMDELEAMYQVMVLVRKKRNNTEEWRRIERLRQERHSWQEILDELMRLGQHGEQR